MPDPYVTQQGLELRYTQHQLRQAFTDDGSTQLNTARLAIAIDGASREADAILGTAWRSADARAALVAADGSIQDAICVLVMHRGTSSRAAFRGSDGRWPYEQQARDARALLDLHAKARLASVGEADAGKNPIHKLRTTHEDPPFQFAPYRGRAPRGGF